MTNIISINTLYSQRKAAGSGLCTQETVYILADDRPAVPSGDNPDGWVATPFGLSEGTLWMARGIKNDAGILQGSWSTPVQVARETLQFTDSRFAKAGPSVRKSECRRRLSA